MTKEYGKIKSKKDGSVYVDLPLGRVTMEFLPLAEGAYKAFIRLKISGSPVFRFGLLEEMFSMYDPRVTYEKNLLKFGQMECVKK